MDISLGRDIAVVWLSLFCIIGLLVPIAALYFSIRGLKAAEKHLINLLKQSQTQAHRINKQTAQFSEQAIRPVMSVRSRVAQTKAAFNRIVQSGSPDANSAIRRTIVDE